MKITKQTVAHVAGLANLEFDEEEMELLTVQFNTILEYMEQINNVDTSKVKMFSSYVPRKEYLRNDIVNPGLTDKDVFENCPEHEANLIKIPLVLGGE